MARLLLIANCVFSSGHPSIESAAAEAALQSSCSIAARRSTGRSPQAHTRSRSFVIGPCNIRKQVVPWAQKKRGRESSTGTLSVTHMQQRQCTQEQQMEYHRDSFAKLCERETGRWRNEKRRSSKRLLFFLSSFHRFRVDGRGLRSSLKVAWSISRFPFSPLAPSLPTCVNRKEGVGRSCPSRAPPTGLS